MVSSHVPSSESPKTIDPPMSTRTDGQEREVVARNCEYADDGTLAPWSNRQNVPPIYARRADRLLIDSSKELVASVELRLCIDASGCGAVDGPDHCSERGDYRRRHITSLDHGSPECPLWVENGR